MGTVMNMSSYEIEQDPMAEEYGEEVMCSGWNPAIALVCQQHSAVPASSRTSIMPANLAAVDVESFLHKMYMCQR